MSCVADGGDAQYAVVFPHGAYKTATRQAQIQLFCMAITLGIAVASGLATGILLRLPILASQTHLYDDHDIWDIPEVEPALSVKEVGLMHQPSRLRSSKNAVTPV